jgi:hypothetical protein
MCPPSLRRTASGVDLRDSKVESLRTLTISCDAEDRHESLALKLAASMSSSNKISPELQRIGCDFNAIGLSGEPNDNCFYSFEREQVSSLPALVGLRVVLFSLDSPSEVTACEAVIEPYRNGWRGEPMKSFWYCGFRARPVNGSWYNGLAPWLSKHSP